MELQDLVKTAALTTKVDLIAGPDGQCGVEVLGRGSQEYQSVSRKQSVAAIQRYGDAASTNTKDLSVATAAFNLQLERQKEVALACVKGVYGFTASGKPVEPTKENVIQILNARPDFVETINAAVLNDANFTGASPATS